MSVIIGNRYCFRLLTLFSWRELLIQHTLSSSLKVFSCGWTSRVSSNIFLFSYSAQSKSAFDVHLDEWVLSWPQHICLFMLCVQHLCCKAFESIFTKGLGFELDVKHVFHGIEFVWILNLQVDKVGWTNQTIPCFLLSSLTWIESWIASLYSGWCRIWRYHCQRLKPTKGLMRLFYQTWAMSSLTSWRLCAFWGDLQGSSQVWYHQETLW